MPNFRHDDRVIIKTGKNIGKSGAIFGGPRRLPVILGSGEDESLSSVYKVALDESDTPVFEVESYLTVA